MNIPIPQIKNLDIQTIIGAIAAIIATVGLIGGITTSSTNSNGSSDSAPTAVDSDPQFVQDFYATAVKWLEAQGYTVTNEATSQAQAEADAWGTGSGGYYDVSKYSSNQAVVAPAWFEQMTAAFEVEIQNYNQLGIPKNSKGEAGVGVAFGVPSSSVVFLREYQQ